MIRHFTASAVILSGNRVLLLASAKGSGWIYPGGHVVPDEDPAEAVIREVREEVGLEIDLLVQPRFSHPKIREVPSPFTIMDVAVRDRHVGLHHHVDFVYAARPTTTSISLNHESTAFRWVPVVEVGELPVPQELPGLIAAAAAYAESLA